MKCLQRHVKIISFALIFTVGKTERKRLFLRPSHVWENYTKIDIKELMFVIMTSCFLSHKYTHSTNVSVGTAMTFVTLLLEMSVKLAGFKK